MKIVDAEVRRAEITDAAARLIARSGIGAVTMREVAAESGWTTGVVTHYFTDKRDLLAATLDASLSRRRTRQMRDRLGTPFDALRASLARALPTDADSRRHWMVTVAFCAEATGDAGLAEMQRDAYRSFRSYIAELVCEVGGLVGAAAVETAEELIAVVDGVAIQALFDQRSWPAKRQMTVLDRRLDELRLAERPSG
jgi:AcrR family transcriptional regulator